MYLIPIVRVNRAIAATLLYPQHPILNIATTEVISVFGPFLYPEMYTKIIALTLCIMYYPNYAYFFITNYQKNQNIYYQAEICTSLLFILTCSINKLNTI
tara:strand:- start:1666 stop:1965 length:300 start_codon:yes stop_codon:yes gene_type:complete